MALNIHYRADFAAQGGPGFTGPVITGVADNTTGAVVMQFDFASKTWVVADSEGNVYAQSEDPGDLADWLSEYADALGQMYRDGELG